MKKKVTRRVAAIRVSYTMMQYFLEGKLRKLDFQVEGLPKKFSIIRVNDNLDIGRINEFTVTIESKELPLLEEGQVIVQIKPIYREKI